MKNFPHGIGEALGDPIVTCSTLRTSGLVYYVSSITGNDTYAGLDRVKPLATLQAAVTLALTCDTIVLLPAHTENISATITLNYQIFLVGSGSVAGIPTPTLTWTGSGAGPMFDVLNDAVLIGGIKFAASTVGPNAVIFSLGEGIKAFTIRGCYFQLGAFDYASVMSAGDVEHAVIENTTFISTATVVTAQPVTAIVILSGGETGTDGWVMDNVTFDGGAAGFSNFAAFDDTLAYVVSGLYENITLANGADMKLSPSSTGILNVIASEEGGMVDW